MPWNTPTPTTTVTNEYLLGLGGEQITVLGQNAAWQWTNVYAGAKQLATYDSAGTHFTLTDWLGSKRMQLSEQISGTTATVTVGEQCTSLPYGDGMDCTGSDVNQLYFTGKERDTESGNDYFGARYYSSNMGGRFLSPDPLLESGRPDNPQSWNRYSYALNDPLSDTDSTGMYVNGSCANTDQSTCSKMDSNLKNMYSQLEQATWNAFASGDDQAGFALTQAVDNLGAPGKKNSSGQNVTINFDSGVALGGQTIGQGTPNVAINLNPNILQDGENGADVLAHEATHVTQTTSTQFFNGVGWSKFHSYAWYVSSEWQPYMTQSYFDQYSPAKPYESYIPTTRGPADLWNSSWSKPDIMSNRQFGVWIAEHGSADADCAGDPQCR